MVTINWSDAIGGERNVTDGPFEFAQITYDTVRTSPDGIQIGYYSLIDGLWYRNGDESGGYTDITIVAE